MGEHQLGLEEELRRRRFDRPGPPSADDLLVAEEVAALLRVTKAWVYAETRAGRIPHLRLGRYVRYRRGALLAWMAEVEERSR